MPKRTFAIGDMRIVPTAGAVMMTLETNEASIRVHLLPDLADEAGLALMVAAEDARESKEEG